MVYSSHQEKEKKKEKRKASSSPKDDELQLESNNEEHLQDEYDTDEELLERDIGWCTQAIRGERGKKKKGKES
jgi:hypothetical protein